MALVDTGLLVRYYLDEAASGDPVTIGDASGNNYDLTATGADVAANMEYVEVSGNRGVDCSSTSGNQRLVHAIDNTSDIIRDADGGSLFTLEVVLIVDAVTSGGSRIFGINNRVGGIGDLILKTTDTVSPFTMTLGYNETDIILTGTDLTAGPRYVVHVVINDTANTVKVYVNGTLTSDLIPTLAVLSIDTNSDLIAFNRESSGFFGRSFNGTLFYAALYNTNFSADNVTTNYNILTSDDDTPAAGGLTIPDWIPNTSQPFPFKNEVVGY